MRTINQTANSCCTPGLQALTLLCAMLAPPVWANAAQAKAPQANTATAAVPPGVQQAEKRKLLRSWQNYFRDLRALDCRWVVKGNLTGGPGEQETIRYAFLRDGRRSRLDTRFFKAKKAKPGDYKSTNQSHDGRFYRSLRTTFSGRNRFDLTSASPESTGAYAFSSLPVLAAFSFIPNGDNEPVSIEALQGDDVWRRFEKCVVGMRRGVWQGRRGYWLLIEDPIYTERKRVFVDGASRFPLFISGNGQYQGEGKHDTSDEAFDSQVTRTMEWRAGSGTYLFPLQIVQRRWSRDVTNGSEKRTFARIIQEVTARVRINHTLEPKRFLFTIPECAETYYTPEFPAKQRYPYPFVYDPRGGSLWAQEQRQRMRAAEKKRQIAAMPRVYDEKADGKAQIAAALQEAKANNKRVLLQFGANWCLPCHKLHALLTENPRISNVLGESYVVVNIDLNKGRHADLFKKYRGPGQSGIPFLVLLDADGKRLAAPPNGSFDSVKRGKSIDDPDKILAFLRRWEPKPE